MRNWSKFFIFLLFISSIFFLTPPSESFGNELPQFKAEISSAVVFKIIDTLLFQYGPSFAALFSVDDYNAIGIHVEHIFSEVQMYPEHFASRAVLINLQWIRRIGKTHWGMEYILIPGREYNKSNESSLITRESTLGLIGIGTFFSLKENRITLSGEGKFANRDLFTTDAGLITMFRLAATINILRWTSLSCELRYWSNAGLHEDEINKDILEGIEKNWGSVYPSLQFEIKGLRFYFGPLFYLDNVPSRYENKFTLYGTVGYSLKKR